MAKSMVLNQGYRDVYSFVIIGGFLVLSVVKMATVFSQGQFLTIQGVALLLTVALLGVFIYFLSKTRLKVKVGAKKVSIMISPFGITKIKFKRKIVDKVSFFTADAIVKSSGLLIHFGHQDRIFNFGGNQGMTILLKNGRKFTFFSQHLFDQKEEIERLLS